MVSGLREKSRRCFAPDSILAVRLPMGLWSHAVNDMPSVCPLPDDETSSRRCSRLRTHALSSIAVPSKVLPMTPAEFIKKWAKYSGKETSAYQEHFNDLCALLGQASPAAADPTGSESFCFQKRVVKDAQLFALEDSGRIAEEANADRERGFADVWKRGFFAWEYKGKKKNLDTAYQQLLRYRESLLNPPLLVVCDFDRYIVRTNFNGTVQETHEFTNAEIDMPRVQHVLHALFTSPDFLKPQRTTDEVTAKLAQQIGEVARSLQERESVELI